MISAARAHEISVPERRVTVVPPEGWELVEDWDEVARAAARPSVFLSRDWASAWWRAFGDGLQPLLVRVADPDGRTMALAPLYLSAITLGPVRLRRLGLIGDQVVGSEYLGLIAREGDEAEAAEAVAGWLRESGTSWDICQLHGLVEGDPAAAALAAALSAGAPRTHFERHGCSAVPLPDDFEGYLAGLGSKFRLSYRQRANKLGRTFAVRVFTTERDADLPEHLDGLFAMHQARWTAEGRPGAFADTRMRAFYGDVARRLLASGLLRFWHLELDGVIRASQFGFVAGDALLSLQEAYDTQLRGPGVGGLGVVLRGHALREAIGAGIRTYDFLGGEEDFKVRWGTRTHYVRHVDIAGPGLRGRVAWARLVGARLLRRRLVAAMPDDVKRRILRMRARRAAT